jgi:23S rRNA U2552 (ribose-2'-O)-methylase RlmE/FtsJ
MTFYQFPRSNFLSYKQIDYIASDTVPTPIISQSLSTYLYDIKQRLEPIESDWDTFKKYTNPYEYIHSVVPFKKKCVSKYSPLSRSYFKMIEIVNTFHLQFDSKPIRTFHLAEGPGGFIEAMVRMRNCKHDSYTGMTIIDKNNDPNIPGWKKSENFLKQNKNVYIETGADNTGNILSLQNFEYCKDKYGSSMDLITADGGFDFSIDFNKQEINIAKLLFAQVCYALVMQKLGGTYILKIFDCFMPHSIDILYILSSFYEKVYIIKPYTSRYANSEKYIVCKGFIFNSCQQFFPSLHQAFEKMVNAPADTHVSRFLNFRIPLYFLTKVDEYNAVFGQQQIENIYYTITLIDNKHKYDKIETLIRNNVLKCQFWCTKNKVTCNQISGSMP